MPLNVDPEKMHEAFREHTDCNSDDPDQRRAMLRAFLWLNAWALVAVVGLLWLVSSPGLPALSVIAFAVAAFGVGCKPWGANHRALAISRRRARLRLGLTRSVTSSSAGRSSG